MSIDFLSSDIEFPSDSNEPKLSASSLTKMPEPVDWVLHDHYSTVLERSRTSIQSFTDLYKLEPVKEDLAEKLFFTSVGTKNLPLFELSDKQDEKAMLLALANHIKPVAAALSTPTPDPSSDLRAALRGALELVENDMQRNSMQDSHSTPPRPVLVTKSEQDHWNWKNELLQTPLKPDVHLETAPVNIRFSQHWDDQQDFVIESYQGSPMNYENSAMNEPPILLDSSIASTATSIYEASILPELTMESMSPVDSFETQPKIYAEPIITVKYVSTPLSPKPTLWKSLVSKFKKMTSTNKKVSQETSKNSTRIF
ncbi:hypothetical protein BDF14DRAFT_1740948 [Spinellus fusiger]|nr:hypothetical protein BDF14DRAFT_1740948 [Spinellus fusiger]